MRHVDDSQTHRATSAYIKASMRAPLLDRDDELDLARAWRERGDQTALHALVQAYARLVVATAVRFRHYGLPLADLIQEGNLGLMQAAARFEPERDVRLSTYAAWWIRAQMQDYVLRNWSIVRTGTTAAQKALFFNLRRLRARLGDGGREQLDDAGRARVADALKVRVADVVEMDARLAQSDQSLSIGIGEDGREAWQDLLQDAAPDPEAVTAEAHDSRRRVMWLKAAIDELQPRERTIIARRHLAGGGASLEEVGVAMGVSKERVRQIEQRAFAKLRTALLRRVEESRDLLPA